MQALHQGVSEREALESYRLPPGRQVNHQGGSSASPITSYVRAFRWFRPRGDNECAGAITAAAQVGHSWLHVYDVCVRCFQVRHYQVGLDALLGATSAAIRRPKAFTG